MKGALDAIEATKTDSEVAGLILSIKDATLDEALRAAKGRTLAFDNATKPINQAIEKLEGQSPSGFHRGAARYSALGTTQKPG